MRRLIDAERSGEINPATRGILGDVVETYLPVATQDRAAWRQQLETEGGDIMALEATELTWRSRIDLEATLRTRREDIRKVAQARFGSLSPEMEAVIAETEAPAFASISRFCAMRLPMGLTSASAKLALHVPRVGPVLSYA